MKIKYLTNQDIDKKKWDFCIKNSYNSQIYGFSWYLDIVCDDWSALVQGDYRRVMPLPIGKNFLMKYVYSPMFSNHLGIFSLDKLSPEIIQHIIKEIPHRFRYVEIDFNKFNNVPESNGHVEIRNSYELDLIPAYTHTIKRYNASTLGALKNATVNNLSIERKLDVEEFFDFYETCAGNQLKGIGNKDWPRVNSLVSAMLKYGFGEIYAAYCKDSTTCAMAFYVSYLHNSTMLFYLESPKGKRFNAFHLLVDFFIKNNSRRNITMEFNPCNVTLDPEIYLHFGCNATKYTNLKIDRRPAYLKFLKVI